MQRFSTAKKVSNNLMNAYCTVKNLCSFPYMHSADQFVFHFTKNTLSPGATALEEKDLS
jgi:hypothetical protein